MSNVYKSINHGKINEDDVRVIDYNDLISQKIEKIKKELEKNSEQYTEDGFTLGLNPENVEELLNEQEEIAASADSQAAAEEIIRNAKEEAEKILRIAESDAASIVKHAEEQKNEIISQASREGFEQGYQEGKAKAQGELEIKEKELKQRRTEMERELQRQKEELEPVLVDTILDVFSDMTHLLALDKKDLILTIVNSVFEGIDVSKNYIIRACHEEAAFLKENRKKIVSGVSDVSIEIVEDLSMKRGQCIIDTDVGVFDCSLDIQMEELMADIKMISCAGKRT